jgi:hypothetical protein
MTAKQEKLLAGGATLGIAGLVWWFWPRSAKKTSAGARVSSELVIDDNVLSPTFGLPLYGPPAPAVAVNPDMQRLIDQSNAAIEADNADSSSEGSGS